MQELRGDQGCDWIDAQKFVGVTLIRRSRLLASMKVGRRDVTGDLQRNSGYICMR